MLSGETLIFLVCLIFDFSSLQVHGLDKSQLDKRTIVDIDIADSSCINPKVRFMVLVSQEGSKDLLNKTP